MPTPNTPPSNRETTPLKPVEEKASKKSLLTRLKASFEAKVSKSAYDSLLSKHEQVKREKQQRQTEYNELLNEATEIKAKKEEINDLYKALVKEHRTVKKERDNLKSTLAEIEKFVDQVEDVTEDSK